jgi:hypothetical protein
MNSLKATARRAGALYLLFMVIAIVGEFLLPSFVVQGDAAATATRITANEAMYRVSLLIAFTTLVIFILVALSLYDLFRDVDGRYARLMLVFVCIGVSVAFANLSNKVAALLLLSGADYLACFTRLQLAALVLTCFRLHNGIAALAMAFWGLWLFPFGMLVIKSRYFPRVLGFLLLVAGSAYVISSVTSIGFPAYRSVVSRFMWPLYFGEVPIILWLLIKGAEPAEA